MSNMKARSPSSASHRSLLARVSLLATFVLSVVMIILPAFAQPQDKQKNVWVPMEERVKIWDTVAGAHQYAISGNELEAKFTRAGTKWIIIGANAPIVELNKYPNSWPVKGNNIDVLVIPEPISDYKILPFTEPITNSVKSEKMSVVVAPDSYEPASFVIRSGDIDLNNVIVEASDLRRSVSNQERQAGIDVIAKRDVDIRIVKCWYQAGVRHNDVTHKTLTPELLLHDDDLIRVDYNRQVNIIRNFEQLSDAESLKPFFIPRKQNKQVWLTIRVDKKTLPGKYIGDVNVLVGSIVKAKLKLDVEVLPFVLPEPMLDFGVYYLGYLSGRNEPVISSDLKTAGQMKHELQDMKEHGLTNATLFHHLTKSTDSREIMKSWRQLQQALDIRTAVGWGKKPLLYLDWEPTFKDNLTSYKGKIDRILKMTKTSGIDDVYIYGLDEVKGERLLSERPMFEVVHQAGARNFVACNQDFYTYVSDLLDLPVLHGKSNRTFMNDYRKTNKPIWVYSNIGSRVEVPETYRYTYGVGLLKEGFSGALVFAYQAFYWNDFQDTKYRAHTLAYPTQDKPIPTIQWEGWRAGINDIRFLTILKNRKQLSDAWLKEQCFPSASICRKNVIGLLLGSGQKN